jgi:hypothetical protein
MALPGADGILRAVRHPALCCLLAVFAAAAPAGAQEPPLAAGDRLAPFELADQHGAPGKVDESVRLLLFAADMDAGDLVNQALEADPALTDLGARGAVFVSDIHRMPALVTRLFALPSMRRRPYRMLLDRGPGPTLRLPREEGKVSILVLDGLRIRSVAFAATPEAVAEALRGPN